MCVNTAVSCNWVLFAMPRQAFAGDEGHFDPESTNAFTRVHDCTVEMVLPTMMLSGKIRASVSKVATTSFGLSASAQRGVIVYSTVKLSTADKQVKLCRRSVIISAAFCHAILAVSFNVDVELGSVHSERLRLLF